MTVIDGRFAADTGLLDEQISSGSVSVSPTEVLWENATPLDSNNASAVEAINNMVRLMWKPPSLAREHCVTSLVTVPT